MISRKPNFDTKKLDNDSLEQKPIKKTRARKTIKPIIQTQIEKIKEEKIDRQLTNIYKDDSGRMPDMREIKKVKGTSFVSGLFKFVFTVAILAALAWAGFFLLPLTDKFSDAQVNLTISGPEKFTIGATSTYQIIFKNNQNIALNKSTLTINYPAGFIYSQSSLEPKNNGKNEWDLGTINPKEEKTIKITGVLYGSIGTDQSWRVFLNYSPANIQSEMQKISTLNVRPHESPIELLFSGVDKIALDSESAYTISIKSKNGFNSKNIVITPIFPSNFHITSSTPALEKNVWNLKSTTSTDNSKPYLITFVGKYGVTEENTSTLKLQAKLPVGLENYLLSESSLNQELIKNVVTVNTAINGSLSDIESKPGDILNFTISLKNSGKEEITKAQLKLTIDAPSYQKQSTLAWSEIVDKNDGDISGKQISDTIRRGTIVWDGSDNSGLTKIKPGEEVILDFQLPIKAANKAPWDEILTNLTKITIEATFIDKAKVTQTISGNPINITLNSDLSLQIKDEIDDDKGKEKHNMTWVINNTFHALKNITLTADIYGNITWQGPTTVPAGTINFDEKNSRLTWTIPEMTQNTDVLALPFSVIINEKNPTQNILVSKVNLTAYDTVSNKELKLLGEEIPLNN